MGNILEEDLNHILENTKDLWEEIRGGRIFITGGTGFFGCWLLESFAWANDHLDLKANALVLTRNFESFQRKAPHLAAHPAIRFHIGDVRDFKFPADEFSHVLHAATEVGNKSDDQTPLDVFETITQGTRQTLDFAVKCNAKKFLLTSSGNVYGKQPPEMTHVPETYNGGPDTLDTASTYAEGKRVSELLCAVYADKYNIETKIARCFAFVGPYLPLDAHFAIGNFIRDALTGGPIIVKGDGSPYRSYLYAADLIICLWTILFKGRACYPYNVGSDMDLTIKTLANEVASVFGSNIEVKMNKQPASGIPADRYVPSTRRIRSELNLEQHIDLKDAIRRTGIFYSKVTIS